MFRTRSGISAARTAEVCFTLGIGLVLLTTAAWGQTHDQSAAFHVTWKSRTSAVARTIEGGDTASKEWRAMIACAVGPVNGGSPTSIS